MLGITPGWKPHDELEADLRLFAECCGFQMIAQPYHEWADDEIKQEIAVRFTPTTLNLRGRADRFAFHHDGGNDFEAESKTHASSTKWDMTLEALPLLQHIIKWLYFQTDTVYCYRDKKVGDRGFLVSEMPPIRCAMIMGTRWGEYWREYFETTITRVLPDVPVVHLDFNSGGSNDPFVIIDEDDKNKLSDWKDIIVSRME